MKKIAKIFEKIIGGKVEYKIDPPDLIVLMRGRVNLIRYLIAEEVDYGIKELSPDKMLIMINMFSELLDVLPPYSEAKIIKRRMSIEKLLRKISNEMMNLRATLDIVEEPHIKRRAEVKLKILEALYENIVRSKPITRVNLVIKIRVTSNNISNAKHLADVYSSKTIGIMQNYFGIKMRMVNRRKELMDILKNELGLSIETNIKSIIVDSERLSTMMPLPKNKKPTMEKEDGLPIGIDIETGWPVIIPYKSFDKHILILGPTGRGKTTLLASMIEGITNLSNILVFAIDFKGDLANMVYSENVVHLTPDDYPINILVIPSFFQVIDWYLAVSDVLSNVIGVDKENFIRVMNKFANNHQAIDGKDILFDKDLSLLSPLIELITSKPKYEALMKHLNNHIVFDLGKYGTAFQNAYGGILMYIYKKLAFSTKMISKPKLLIVDEAWRISRLNGLEELVKEGRSKHLGVVLATQNPRDIPREIMENTHLLIMFGSRNEDYLRDAERFLGLPREIVKKLAYLGVGEALLLNALDPHPVILRVRTPTFMREKYKHIISDDERRA